MENNNTLSSNLERIKSATDDLREIVGMTEEDTIEDVVDSLSGMANLDDYFVSTWNNGGFTETMGSWVLSVKKLPPITKISTWLRCFNRYPGEYLDFSKLADHCVYCFAEAFIASKLVELDLSRIIKDDYVAPPEFYQAFSNCSMLKSLNMRCNLYNVRGGNNQRSNLQQAFIGCSNLENLVFGYNLGQGYGSSSGELGSSIDLSDCSKLTHESIMSVINGLYDITSKGLSFTPYVKLHADAYARLSSEEIQIATNKGWNIISA